MKADRPDRRMRGFFDVRDGMLTRPGSYLDPATRSKRSPLSLALQFDGPTRLETRTPTPLSRQQQEYEIEREAGGMQDPELMQAEGTSAQPASYSKGRKARTVAEVVAAEAGGKTTAQRLSAMKDVFSAMLNRAQQLGVPLADVVSVTKEFNAYNKKMPAGTASLVDLAQQAMAEVMASGPTHKGTFYARSYATKNLPKGLTPVKTAVDGHEYFEDPQGRAIRTAQGFIKPNTSNLPETVEETPSRRPNPLGTPDVSIGSIATKAALAAALRSQPETEVFAAGTNDFDKPKVATQALAAAAANAKAKGRNLVAVMPNAANPKIAPAAQAIADTAARLGIQTITPSSWAKDGIHPSMAAYKEIAAKYDGAIVRGDSFAKGIISAQATKNPLSFGQVGVSSAAVISAIGKLDSGTPSSFLGRPDVPVSDNTLKASPSNFLARPDIPSDNSTAAGPQDHWSRGYISPGTLAAMMDPTPSPQSTLNPAAPGFQRPAPAPTGPTAGAGSALARGAFAGAADAAKANNKGLMSWERMAPTPQADVMAHLTAGMEPAAAQMASSFIGRPDVPLSDNTPVAKQTARLSVDASSAAPTEVAAGPKTAPQVEAAPKQAPTYSSPVGVRPELGPQGVVNNPVAQVDTPVAPDPVAEQAAIAALAEVPGKPPAVQAIETATAQPAPAAPNATPPDLTLAPKFDLSKALTDVAALQPAAPPLAPPEEVAPAPKVASVPAYVPQRVQAPLAKPTQPVEKKRGFLGSIIDKLTPDTPNPESYNFGSGSAAIDSILGGGGTAGATAYSLSNPDVSYRDLGNGVIEKRNAKFDTIEYSHTGLKAPDPGKGFFSGLAGLFGGNKSESGKSGGKGWGAFAGAGDRRGGWHAI